MLEPRGDIEILGHSSGFEVVLAQRQVFFYDRRTRGPGILAAVAGGLTFILVMNAAVFGLMISLDGDPKLGLSVAAGELVAACVTGGLTWLGLRRLADRRAASYAQLEPIVVADLGAGQLLDAQGRAFAPLSAARVAKAMLVTSSAPGVYMRVEGAGRYEVFRGSLFGRGVEYLLERLHGLGLR